MEKTQKTPVRHGVLVLTLGLVSLAVLTILGAILVSGRLTGEAVQNPSISLDMDTAGNTYVDSATTNTMVVGTIDNCLETAAPGDNALHVHPVHVVVRDVEDIIGFQLRVNYDGGQMRPSTVDLTPFTDGSTFQDISFLNLPLDGGVHRDLTSASTIPAQAAGPQTALIGASYLGAQTAPVSPDTPAKTVPDDASYTAATGGVLATLNLQVLAGQALQSLTMDEDDGVPNAPGSSVTIFDGVGQSSMNLAEGALGDGFHGEGTACVFPTPTATVTATATATATATPTATPTSTATPTVTPQPNPCRGAPGSSATPPHDISLDALRGAGRIRDSQAKTYTALVTNHNLTGTEDIQVCFTVVPLFGCSAPEIDVALPYDATPGEPDNAFVDVSGDGVPDSVAPAVARGVLPNRSERVKATVFFSSCPPAPNQQDTPFDYIVQADACHEGDPAPKGFFGGACPGIKDGANDPNQNNDAPIQKAVNDVLR